jgi:hypothetical protein
MNINFDAQLTGPNQEIIPSSPEPGAPPMTLKDVCMSAVLTQMQGDAETKGQGYRLYTLAHKINAGGQVHVAAMDVVLIKDRIERIFPPWIIGCAWDLLDPREVPGIDPGAA